MSVVNTSKITEQAVFNAEDKYSLVLLAAKRARSISFGSKSLANENLVKGLKPVQTSLIEISIRALNNANFAEYSSASQSVANIGSLPMSSKVPTQKIGPRKNAENIFYENQGDEEVEEDL